MVGGACGSDGADRRRTLEGGSDEDRDQGSQDQAPRSAKPSRPDDKSGNQQHRRKPARADGGRNKGTRRSSQAASAPRQSKQAAVIALLRRSEGVTIGEVVSATGWQPHTVRGLFSGTLKKKLGLALNSAPEEGRGRVYRIMGATGTAGEAGTRV